MLVKIVDMDNARGIKLPEDIMTRCGFTDEARLTMKNGGLFVEPVRPVRQGWAEAARELAASGEAPLLADAPTQWDATEWEW